eukprot:1158418-Pelagomonas_calceolata.AAC.5
MASHPLTLNSASDEVLKTNECGTSDRVEHGGHFAWLIGFEFTKSQPGMQDASENVLAVGCFQHSGGPFSKLTGAPVPPGADAVVQIEDTQPLDVAPNGEQQHPQVDLPAGSGVLVGQCSCGVFGLVLLVEAHALGCALGVWQGVWASALGCAVGFLGLRSWLSPVLLQGVWAGALGCAVGCLVLASSSLMELVVWTGALGCALGVLISDLAYPQTDNSNSPMRKK